MAGAYVYANSARLAAVNQAAASGIHCFKGRFAPYQVSSFCGWIVVVPHIAIIGGGPAGLRAAEILAEAGEAVTLFDHKPSVGRKFLLAGRGGLNLTHSEGLETFIPRYGAAAEWLASQADRSFAAI